MGASIPLTRQISSGGDTDLRRAHCPAPRIGLATKAVMKTELYSSWGSFMMEACSLDGRPLSYRSRAVFRSLGVAFLAFVLKPAMPEIIDPHGAIHPPEKIDEILRARLASLTSGQVSEFLAERAAKKGDAHDGQEALYVLKQHLSRWTKANRLVPAGILPEDEKAVLESIIQQSELYNKSAALIASAGTRAESPLSRESQVNARNIISRFLRGVLTGHVRFDPSSAQVESYSLLAKLLDQHLKENFLDRAKDFIALKSSGGQQKSKQGSICALSALRKYFAGLIPGGADALNSVYSLRTAAPRRPAQHLHIRPMRSNMTSPASHSQDRAPLAETTAAHLPAHISSTILPDREKLQAQHHARLETALNALYRALGLGGKHLLYELGLNDVRVFGEVVRVFTSKLPRSKQWCNFIDFKDPTLRSSLNAYCLGCPKWAERDPFFFVDYDGKRLPPENCRRK